MSNNKFTILTSSYNCGVFLSDWASSILAQSYRPLEVIFVNDCSADMAKADVTKDVIVPLEEKIRAAGIEIKVIHNVQRLYCGSSYNVALNNATGFYFGVLDADDMLEPNAVSNIVDLYNQNPNIFWIYTQFSVHNAKMKYIGKGFCVAPRNNDTLLSLGAKGIHAFSHWRTFSKRIDRIDKLFKDGLRCAVDKYMGYRLEEFGPGMFVNRVFYRYRRRMLYSISRSENTRQVWSDIMKKAQKRRLKYGKAVYSIRECNS